MLLSKVHLLKTSLTKSLSSIIPMYSYNLAEGDISEWYKIEEEIAKVIEAKHNIIVSETESNRLRYFLTYGRLTEDKIKDVVQEKYVYGITKTLSEFENKILSYYSINKELIALEHDGTAKNECFYGKMSYLVDKYKKDFVSLINGTEPDNTIFKNFVVDQEYVNDFCSAVDIKDIDKDPFAPVYKKLNIFEQGSLDDKVAKEYKCALGENQIVFNDVQKSCIWALESNESNILICSPTNSGKTICGISGMIWLRKRMEKGKAFYAVPTKCLLEEKYVMLTKYFSSNMKVLRISTDYPETDYKEIREADICVGTIEKLDILTRNSEKFDLIVLDEIHILGSDRGGAIEAIVARSSCRIIGMSATIPSIEAVRSFLRVPKSNCIVKEEKYERSSWEFNIRPLSHTTTNEVVKRVLKVNKKGLVFVNERSQTRKLAEALIKASQGLKQSLPPLELEDQDLLQLIELGVCTHHAGLSHNDRRIIEKLYIDGYVRTLVATTTLAWGINLPCDLVIVYGSFTNIDILQMFGRVARSPTSSLGTCIYYGPSISHSFDSLPSYFARSLLFHLNTEIYLGLSTLSDAVRWFEKTYYAAVLRNNYDDGKAYLSKIKHIIFWAMHELERHGLIQSMRPTFFSYLSHRFYISPNALSPLWKVNRFYDEAALYEIIAEIMEYDDERSKSNAELSPYPTTSTASFHLQKAILLCSYDTSFLQNASRIATLVLEYTLARFFSSAYTAFVLCYKLSYLLIHKDATPQFFTFQHPKGISVKAKRSGGAIELSIWFNDTFLKNFPTKVVAFVSDSSHMRLLSFSVCKFSPRIILYFESPSLIVNLRLVCTWSKSLHFNALSSTHTLFYENMTIKVYENNSSYIINCSHIPVYEELENYDYLVLPDDIEPQKFYVPNIRYSDLHSLLTADQDSEELLHKVFNTPCATKTYTVVIQVLDIQSDLLLHSIILSLKTISTFKFVLWALKKRAILDYTYYGYSSNSQVISIYDYKQLLGKKEYFGLIPRGLLSEKFAKLIYKSFSRGTSGMESVFRIHKDVLIKYALDLDSFSSISSLRNGIKPTDIVLEVGAGNGSITLKLLEKARKVIAFENDPAMARELKSRLKTGDRNKLELIEEDVLSHDFGHFDVCISNIPFHISLPLILKLLPCDFRSAFLLVQKEFAARLTARPGSADYSRLSVMSHLLVNVEHITKVARNNFIPPPNVDTCFIKLEPKIPRPEIDVNEFGNMLKLCFNRKNKMLISNLKSSNLLKLIESDDNYEGIDPSVVIDEILERANLADARPSKMEVEDFLTLLLFFKQAGFHF